MTTHIVEDPWAESVVMNDPKKMPKAAHAGDRCWLADNDCDVTFERDEAVFFTVRGGNQTQRGRWVCGLHIDRGPKPFERKFVR